MSIDKKDAEIERLNDILKKMENSRSWKITRPLRVLKENSSAFIRKVQKALLLYRTGGINLLLKFIFSKIVSIFNKKSQTYFIKINYKKY